MIVDESWLETVESVKKAKERYPWHDKQNKIFWRGALTGPIDELVEYYSLENYDKLPRMTISMLSRSYPDFIDAKLTNYAMFQVDRSSPKLLAVIALLQLGSKRVEIPDHLQYKYLASVDGTSCTGTRVPWIMLSNSVLLKQETDKIEWFYPALKPYVNYVPMNERLTDIFQQLAWMESHQEEVQQISKKAQNFVENNLMPEDIEAHTVIILNEYSKLHKGIEIKPTLASFESYADIIENNDIYGKKKLKACLKRWGR